MKNLLFVFFTSFILFSCQDSYEDISDISNETSSVRDRDCEKNYTAGNVWGDLFGSYPTHSMDREGWSGTFENQFFPCPPITEAGDCCNETVFVDYGQINESNLSFEFTCNDDLSIAELQELDNLITSIANQDLPVCDGITLHPIAINVTLDIITCCVDPNPCPFYDDPCMCRDMFPNIPYWGCCESYNLSLEVLYGRTTPCPTVFCC